MASSECPFFADLVDNEAEFGSELESACDSNEGVLEARAVGDSQVDLDQAESEVQEIVLNVDLDISKIHNFEMTECKSELPMIATLPNDSDRNSTEPVVISSDQDEEETSAVPTPPPVKQSRGTRTSRGRPRRGRRRGKGSRIDTTALDEETGRQQGHRVNDDDGPTKLQEVVSELDTVRRNRTEQALNDTVNVEDDEIDEDFIVKELFNGDTEAVKFEWSPMTTFTGRREAFLPKSTGPTCKTTSAYEVFRLYWDDDIMEHITKETNRYAAQIKSSKFAQEWYDTNMHEIFILFAFWMMIGIVRMPSIKSCFSNNPLLETSVFKSLLTEARYWVLNRALHFTDNCSRAEDSFKLFGLSPVAEHLNKKFMECYIPNQNISIHESLVMTFKQCNKSKAQRDMKSYELFESSTGYLWSVFIYTGKDRTTPTTNSLPKSTEAVVKLIKPLLNKGYTVFLDNSFTSPILARFLKRNKTDCVGTLRSSRKYVPPLIHLASVPESTCIARHAGDIMVMKYDDKKPVCMISTYHDTKSVYYTSKLGTRCYKPAVIRDFNKSIVVDKKDQTLEPYLLECNKNPVKMFKQLLNVSISNSRILVDRSRESPVREQDFRLELAQEIIRRHLPLVVKPPPRDPKAHIDSSDLPDSRIIGSHFIMRAGVGDERRSDPNRVRRTSKNRRYCIWCRVREKRHSRTVYICDRCQVPLCLDGCFKKFHTVP